MEDENAAAAAAGGGLMTTSPLSRAVLRAYGVTDRLLLQTSARRMLYTAGVLSFDAASSRRIIVPFSCRRVAGKQIMRPIDSRVNL